MPFRRTVMHLSVLAVGLALGLWATAPARTADTKTTKKDSKQARQATPHSPSQSASSKATKKDTKKPKTAARPKVKYPFHHELIRELGHSWETLNGADADYAGHRLKAMHHVHEAANALRADIHEKDNLPATPRKGPAHVESQARSNGQVREVIGRLRHVERQLNEMNHGKGTPGSRKAHEEARHAIHQLEAALAVKPAGKQVAQGGGSGRPTGGQANKGGGSKQPYPFHHQLIRELHHAWKALDATNADYDGHRAQALLHIHGAAHALIAEVGDRDHLWTDRGGPVKVEAQRRSDKELRTIIGRLRHIEHQLNEMNNGKGTTGSLRAHQEARHAIHQLEVALAVR